MSFFLITERCTGTFLAEATRQIYRCFADFPAELWQDHAENCLLLRLMGFELLIASYAMTHIKLDDFFSATD